MPGLGLGDSLEFSLVFEAVDNASSVMEGIGHLLESFVSTTADFQSQLVEIQNNTTMTAADVATMRQGILALSASSGAGLDQLGNSFQRIQNVTGNVETAIDILKQGTESAISTGGDLVDTNLLLATVMHEYGADVSTATSALQRHADVSATAAHYMGILHLAAAESRTTLSDFVETGGQAIAWAANLQVPIEDVAAAFATLTLHGFDAAESATQLRNDFIHIMNPAKAARDELAALSKQSGIDLVGDFSAGGLASKHLEGVMSDLQAAFHNLGFSQAQATEETTRLIPNLRGTAGAFILTGTGAKDYARILRDLTNEQKVNTTTQQAYERTQQTFANQVAVVTQQFNLLKMVVGQPILQVLQTDLIRFTDYLKTHQDDVRQWADGVGQGLAGAVALVSIAVPAMFRVVGTEWQNLKTMVGDVGTFFDTTGTGINAALRGIASGLYDTVHGFITINEQMFNGVLTIINTIMNKVWQVTESMNIPGGPYGEPPGLNAVPLIDIPTAAQAVRDRASFMQGMFGAPLNPATGRPYAGGGGQQAAGGSVRGGGGGSYSPDMPGVNLEDAAAVARWQLQHPGSIIPAFTSGAGTGAGYQNAAALAAATQGASAAQRATQAAAQQAAQQALADARDRFSLDQLNKAPQTALLRDISVILKDMKGLGSSQVSIDLEHARDLAAINQNTKTTATQRAALTLSLLPGGTYARPDQAGYGSTIASFGIQQRDHVAEMVAILRQELAASQRRERHDEEVIATMQATLREQRTGTQAATLTAGNTTRLVAMGATAPAPYRDPRARVGAVHP
jgi:TP901 family phage tail tape measure protein